MQRKQEDWNLYSNDECCCRVSSRAESAELHNWRSVRKLKCSETLELLSWKEAFSFCLLLTIRSLGLEEPVFICSIAASSSISIKLESNVKWISFVRILNNCSGWKLHTLGCCKIRLVLVSDAVHLFCSPENGFNMIVLVKYFWESLRASVLLTSGNSRWILSYSCSNTAKRETFIWCSTCRGCSENLWLPHPWRC